MGVVDLNEWLENLNGEKVVIITNSVKNVNRLLRRYNERTGKPLYHVAGQSLLQLAKEVLLNHAGENGASVSFGNDEDAVFKLEELLNQEAERVNGMSYRFIPETGLCAETARTVYAALGKLRMGKRTDAFENMEGEKAEGLRKLLKDCERIQDTPTILRKAIEVLREDKMRAEKVEAAVLEKEVERFTYLEREFVSALTGKVFRELPVLSYLEYLENGKETKSITDKVFSYKPVFFKEYGKSKEIRFVIEKIRKKRLSYGDVHILYTDAGYEPFLSAAFGAAGIPYSFVSSRSISGSRHVRLLCDILNWAEKDFLYTALEPVFGNTVLKEREKGREQKKGQESGQETCHYRRLYTSYMRKYRLNSNVQGLSWYKQRLLEWEKDDTEKKHTDFLEFMKELVAIFAGLEEKTDGQAMTELLAELIRFCKKQTYSGREKGMIYQALLQELFDEFSAEQKKWTTQTEMFGFFKDRLNRLTLAGSGQTDRVSLELAGGLKVFERRHVFLLGCEAVSFSGKVTESPVLSDEELTSFLDPTAGYISLAGEREREKRDELLYSLCSIPEGGRCYFGYSLYDTVEFMDCAPSVFYADLLEKYKKYSKAAGEAVKEQEVSGYPVEEEAFSSVKTDAFWEKMFSEAEEEKKKDAAKEEDMNKEEPEEPEEPEESEEALLESENRDELQKGSGEAFVFSASRLNKLVKCPRQYFYGCLCYLPEELPDEPKETEWLSAADRGSLLHSVLQKYCEQELMKIKAKDQVPDPDKEALEKLLKQEAEETKKKIPCRTEEIYERFLRVETENLCQYLEKLHGEMKNENWRILACEAAFGDFGEKYPDGKEHVQLTKETMKECYGYKTESGESLNVLGIEPVSEEGVNLQSSNAGASQGKSLELEYHGFIDRIDYKISDGRIEVRVIDYKTGASRKSVEKKKEEIQKEMEIQHLLYEKAIYMSIEDIRAMIGKKEGQDYSNTQVDLSARYDYPCVRGTEYHTGGDRKKSIPAATGNGEPLDNYPDSVKRTIVYALGEGCFERLDAYYREWPGDELYYPTVKKGKPVDERKVTGEEVCEYCAYRRLCANT